MIIEQIPDQINFAGNIKDIILSEVTDKIEFELSTNSEIIISEVYSPDPQGKVTIPLKELMEDVVTSPEVNAVVADIPMFRYEAGNISGDFYCLKGGVGNKIPANIFCKSNFLTWQPQVVFTQYHTPHRLRFTCLMSRYLCKVKGYFRDGSFQEVTYISMMEVKKIHTIDVTYGTIRGLFEEQPVYFDLWVESYDAQCTSYVQRYILVDSFGGTNDYFVFENSLGGFDTIRFWGDKKEASDIKSISALFGSNTFEYDIESVRKWQKYTGYFEKEAERLWVLDFFNSINRYHLKDGDLMRIVVSEPKLEGLVNEPFGYEFYFAYSEQNKYISVERVDTPELLEIVSADNELFFLAPRLNQFEWINPEETEAFIPVQKPHDNKWYTVPLSILRGIGGGVGDFMKIAYQVFHPKGGSEDLDFTAKDVTANSVAADIVDVGSTVTSPVVKSPLYSEGGMTGGTGFAIYEDENGASHAEVDYLSVRKAMEVYMLSIQEAQYLSGIVMEGPAVMLTDRVEELDTFYRCYFDSKGGRIKNYFKIGDQARCQTAEFTADSGLETKYYWRLVVDEGEAGIGEDYIDLSKAGADTGVSGASDGQAITSGIPEAGDVICTCGSRTDTDRQSYIMRYVIGENTPREEFWHGVNSFNPTRGANLQSLRSPSENIFRADSFVWMNSQGEQQPPLLKPEAWSGQGHKDMQYTFGGSTWLCLADTTIAPADANAAWLCLVRKGNDGEGFENLIIGGENLIRNGDFSQPEVYWDIPLWANPQQSMTGGATGGGYLYCGYGAAYVKYNEKGFQNGDAIALPAENATQFYYKGQFRIYLKDGSNYYLPTTANWTLHKCRNWDFMLSSDGYMSNFMLEQGNLHSPFKINRLDYRVASENLLHNSGERSVSVGDYGFAYNLNNSASKKGVYIFWIDEIIRTSAEDKGIGVGFYNNATRSFDGSIKYVNYLSADKYVILTKLTNAPCVLNCYPAGVGTLVKGTITIKQAYLGYGNTRPTSWSISPEDEKARIDGVSAMFDGMTSEQVAEMMKTADNQPFQVVNNIVIMKDAFVQRLAAMEAFINTLVAETAFIKALTVQSLSTQGGNIQLDDTIAKLGSAYIDKAGNYNIKESPTGKPVVSLKRENITKLDDLGGNTPSAETATATLTHIGTIARQQLGASLNVGKDNSTMSVTGTISASARRNSNERGVSSTGVIMLYRVNGSTETLCATVGSVMAVAGGSGAGDESIVINEQLTVSAGTYKLYVATTVNKFSTQDSGSAAFAAKMRFEFTATPLITEIGRNGLCVMGNSANYLHAQYDRTTAALTVKGKGTFDLPGALIGGSIMGSTAAKRNNVSWGKSFKVSKPAGTQGRYVITHDLHHFNYYVSATPVNEGGWAKVHAGIIDKQADYVIIGIYDAGTNSTTVDCNFDFIICGQN